MCKLTFVYSSMNSGKSLSILTKNYTLKQKGFNTIIMKPALDDRTKTISTRLGIEEECLLIEQNENPSELILKSNHDKPDFVMVDEAQFLSKEQVWDLANLVDNWGINVYCYGLRLDWTGNFFSGSEELMKIADELIPIENFCKENKGALAFFHIKKGGSDNPVETGYEDLYDTVSRKFWKQWWDNKNG
jgi:thymidine kinase